jgi:opacity protein-like surface antigen
MRSTRALIIALALIVAGAGLAAAQDPAPTSSRPEQLFGVVGGGMATFKVNYEGAEDTPHSERGSFYAALGFRLTPAVLMGVGVTADRMTENGQTTTTTGFEGFVRWYPGQVPLFLRFGFGMASARLKFSDPSAGDKIVRRGVGLSFGAGYDIRLTSHVSLTPEANWRLMAVGDIPIEGINYRNVSANNWFLGAGVTIH